jgi:hypothetical protein
VLTPRSIESRVNNTLLIVALVKAALQKRGKTVPYTYPLLEVGRLLSCTQDTAFLSFLLSAIPPIARGGKGLRKVDMPQDA